MDLIPGTYILKSRRLGSSSPEKWDDDDRLRGVVNEVVAEAAEHQLGESASPSPTHDKQVGIHRCGEPDQRFDTSVDDLRPKRDLGIGQRPAPGLFHGPLRVRAQFLPGAPPVVV